MSDSLLNTLVAHWEGRRWRWWALIAGLLTVPVTIIVAWILSSITDQRFVPLALLVLMAVILGGSLIGAGFIESLTSQMSRGGLARESSEFVDAATSESEREQMEQRNKEIRDRRTIRAGLFIIAPAAAFIYLLAVV